jgi:DNA polymerase III subunit chi
MTQIDFYFNVTDKYKLAASLSQKAQVQASRMFLYTPDEAATKHAEAMLWSFQQTSFVAHCRSRHVLAAETSIIVDHESEVLVHDDVLLNLCPDYPSFFSRFRRLIDVVGHEETDKAAGRERYRFYRDRGYEIRQHDMTGKI